MRIALKQGQDRSLEMVPRDSRLEKSSLTIRAFHARWLRLLHNCREQESGEVIRPPHASGFPATAPVVLPGAPVAGYPVAGINARLESLPLVPPAWLALGTMTAAIDARAPTGNGPTLVHRLNPIPHPGTILGEGQIAPPQLF
jgi:hypothetical protein